MHLDYIILGMLALRRFSGYDLRRWMEGPGRYIGYGVKLPHIYRRLAALVDKGWVAFDVDPRDGRPDAKIYRMTEAGKQALLDWAHSPYEPSPRPMDPDFKIRFVFGGQLDREIAISVVRTELEYRLKHDLTPTFTPLDTPDAPWARQIHTLAHEQGYASTAAYIAWLQLTLNRLEAG